MFQGKVSLSTKFLHYCGNKNSFIYSIAHVPDPSDISSAIMIVHYCLSASCNVQIALFCAVFLSLFCEICTGNRLVIFIWKIGRWLCLEWDVISPVNVSEVINQISHSRAHHVHVNPKRAETSRSLCFSSPDVNLILFEITVFYLYKVSV